jgi:copper chaperone
MIVERVLAVQGMTCEGCEQAIRGALGRLDGIVAASPDHRAGRVSVRYDTDRVSETAIKQRIRLAGYDTE